VLAHQTDDALVGEIDVDITAVDELVLGKHENAKGDSGRH
jgi:hypothetical protein